MKLKKPKFWDIKKPNLIAYLLLPISLIIQLFVIIKNLTQKNIKLNVYVLKYLERWTGKISSIELNATKKNLNHVL